MRRSLAALALVALCAALAPAARADGYSWLSPEEVQQAMEEKHVPGVFFFEVPQSKPAVNFVFLYQQGAVVEVLKRHKFARIAV